MQNVTNANHSGVKFNTAFDLNTKKIVRNSVSFTGVTEVFQKRLEIRWEVPKIITEENKFSESDIYDYPLEVVYLLYCYPIKLIDVIQKRELEMEYWDFFYGEYPELEFKNDLEEYYSFLRKKYK